jgi:hypothetical protein
MSRRSRKFEMSSRLQSGFLLPTDKVLMKKQRRRREIQVNDLADLQKLMDEAAARDAAKTETPTNTNTEK